MRAPIQHAYEATMPDGRIVRHLGKVELGAALAQRVNLEWKVTWHSSRKCAGAQGKRFMTKMADACLAPERYEVRLLPIRVIEVPDVKWAAARLPGGSKRRTRYIPEWGEAAPIAVVIVANQDGWHTAEWVTTRDAADRERERLRATHDQVMICDAWVEGEYASA